MALYCRIDLHSNNHLVVVIDENVHRLEERRLGNDVSLTLSLLEPYRDQLIGVAVESTFNWYWLVDGLQDVGFRVEFVNPAGIKQYEGLKYGDDRYNAFGLAHLIRLGLLKTGYIYPREQRAIRNVLRRRIQLVRTDSRQLICAQSQTWRSTGIRMSCNTLKKPGCAVCLPDEDLFKPYPQIGGVTEVFEESFVLNVLAHVVHFTRVCRELSIILHD